MKRILLQVTVVLGFVCLSSCASAPAVAPEVCAAQVQPPVPTPEENSAITPPVVVRRVDLRASRSLLGRTAESTVEAIVGVDGKARNICVTGGDPEWGSAVAEVLRQWQFKPAMLNGQPIATRFKLTTKFNG